MSVSAGAARSSGVLNRSTVIALLDLVSEGYQLDAERVRELLAEHEGTAGGHEELVPHVVSCSARMARWRQRDRELSALNSSARELLEVRDVQQLLQKLVERAHDLMGTDVTYLSEYDAATDELWVRANHGAVSLELRGLRVPAGVGLASKVVHTRAPQWTADYDREPDLPRAAEVDAAVAAENLGCLLGTPMIADGQVLGVLFAADRSRRTFSTDEIALLTAFADQAAVILHVARLFDSVRRSAAAAEAAHARVEEHATAMERAAVVHEELTRLVLAGQGVREVAATLARTLRRPVALVDQELCRTAATDGGTETWWDAAGRLDALAVRAVEESRRTGRCVPVGGGTGRGGLPDVVVATVAGARLLGAVLVGSRQGGGAGTANEGFSGNASGDGDRCQGLTRVELRTIERASQIVALLTMQEDALTEAEERVRGELVSDLLSGRCSRQELARRSRSRGIELDQLWSAVAVLVPDGVRKRTMRRLGSARPGWLMGRHRGGVTVLVPGAAGPDAALEDVRSLLSREGVPAIVVAAARAVGPFALAEEVESAWACAELLPGLGVRAVAVRADAYAPYLAMFGPDGARAAGFVRQTIGPVQDWDAAHGTALVPTLEAFVDNLGGVTRTARALFVHTNTVKQRLERIGKLLGEDWQEPEPLFRTTVAVRLHRMGVRDESS